MTSRGRAAAAALAALLAALLPARAEPEPKRPPRKVAPLPRGAPALGDEAPTMSADRFEQTGPGEISLTGEVDFRYGPAHVLADSVRYSESARRVTAEGNVVLTYGASQVSGDRVVVDLDSEYALVEKARAYIEPDVIVDAERLERIGEETFRVTDGTITTCTQPTPYWSFHVGSAIVHVGRYAHMRNASFRLGRVPAFWSPYLVWPIKEDRAAGLLLPHFGFTRKRGAFLSNALYVPMGRSADATLQFDFFNGAVSGLTEQLPQAGQGLELRYVPGEAGSGTLTAYYIRERVRPAPGAEVLERDRYHMNLAHTQRFPAGFKLLVDLNTVSDLDYFLDFEREIRFSTNPTVFSQFDLSRQSGPYALNVRFNRQLQFLGVGTDRGGTLRTQDLTLYRLPEVEFRGRGLRIGRSPFYLTFESALDGFARRTRTIEGGDLETVQTTYSRIDFFPTVSGNFTPAPWLDISPSVAFRETYYAASDSEPGAELDPTGPSVHREQYRLGVSVVGPRLFRLYGGDAVSATRFKHTFEPRVSYDYVPEVTGGEKIIPFDEIDAVSPSNNLLTYSLTSRLFAKRPPKPAEAPRVAPALTTAFASLVLGEESPTRHQELTPAAVPPPAGAPPSVPGGAEAAPGAEAGPREGGPTVPAGAGEASPSVTGGETYIPPDVSTGAGRRSPLGRGRVGPEGARDRAHETAVGSVEIATFDLTQRYSLDRVRPLSRSNALAEDSAFSSVEATVRFNPTYAASVDLRTTYDILFDDIRSVSISGNLRTRDLGYMRLSWFLNRDLEGTAAAANPQCASDPARPVGRLGPEEGRCFNDSSQIRLLGGVALFARKITADVEGSYDIEESFLRDQRYRAGYNTQCCGVLVEVAKRSFQTSAIGATSETEYRFVLNLRGVGTFLDLNGRPQ